MLFRQGVLEKIKNGQVTVAFRRWKKPAVRPGGTLKTLIGVLQFKSIKEVELASLTLKDAKSAGFDGTELLKEELLKREGTIYKISFILLGPDPRLKLRNRTVMSNSELVELKEKLNRLDKYGKKGSWTFEVLKLLDRFPGVGSKILCGKVHMEQMEFKLNVRKLKNLGLTISLGTGYKLSPRGRALLRSNRK